MRTLKGIVLVILLGFILFIFGCSTIENKSNANKEVEIQLSSPSSPQPFIRASNDRNDRMVIYTNNSFIATNGEIIKAKVKDIYKQVIDSDKTLWGIYGVLGIFSIIGIIRLIKKIKRGKNENYKRK